MAMMLSHIFATDQHDYGAIHELVAHQLANAPDQYNVGYFNMEGSLREIDLGGRTYILDRPLEINNCQLVVLRNGTLVAGPTFPKGEYLISCNRVVGISFFDLLLECSKRASGMRFEGFLRVRVEDCHILHQLDYGIYSGPTGGNHELEIFKCHIVEYVYGDGHEKKKSCYGIVPAFDVDANRQSTGIFLGQADNVVADCNINLCRVGIYCGMRANRIQGNHITGGGSLELDLYKGIEANNTHKSSAMITHNYIDNCCLWINCDDHQRMNSRNYFHVTDNLFYRGYNHPKDGTPYSHVVINALKPDSLLGNVHLCDNLFYNQDENLEGIKPRVLYPLRVHTHVDPETGKETGLDHARIRSFRMENNQFTNQFPTFVQPMGTTVTKRVAITPDKSSYKVNFREEIPVGALSQVRLELGVIETGTPRQPILRRMLKHMVEIEMPDPFEGEVLVTATVLGDSKRWPYSVA